MAWSPFADWCRDPKRPWSARDELETEPVVRHFHVPEVDLPFGCFDPFHLQQCTGFGAKLFCPSCGGDWKHPLRVTTTGR